MSKRQSNSVAARRMRRRHASVFAALGDETRLSLLARVCEQAPCSIAQLGKGLPITRQAITKHLRVLESAGLVRGAASGRECLFDFEPRPLQQARDYLELVSSQWDDALTRLQAFVDRPG